MVQERPTLPDLGQQRALDIAGITVSGRRRRPSGEAPPLPYELSASGLVWLILGVAYVLLWSSVVVWPATVDWWQQVDHTALSWLADHRVGWLTSVTQSTDDIASEWALRALRIATLVAAVFFRRWRHLVVMLATILFLDLILTGMVWLVYRPRPFVEIIGSWQGFAYPSVPVAELSATLVLMGYVLIPKGKWRNGWFAFSAAAVILVAFSRSYLGADHGTDALGAVFAAGVAVLAMRVFVPDGLFPVTYRRRKSAHLDLGGARGAAIEKAVQEQLGIDVLGIEPFGLAGSAGSSPLRIQVASDREDERRYIFGKLYAKSHLRADRWYKIVRVILYGSLEDEKAFASVRRLVEYEDYMMLVFARAGVSVAESYGFVEITPEREYLMLTEFFDDAVELGEAEVTDRTIDEALRLVRDLWNVGIAHRDIKPSNVLICDERVRLIDLAFATVRPTPWRQAVDLANMMIILAFRADARRVYERALHYFAPEDIAEAFAATRSVTMPSQSRSSLKVLQREQGRDVIEEFRSMGPPVAPIAIQRWSWRRVRLTIAAAAILFLLFALIVENVTGGGFL